MSAREDARRDAVENLSVDIDDAAEAEALAVLLPSVRTALQAAHDRGYALGAADAIAERAPAPAAALPDPWRPIPEGDPLAEDWTGPPHGEDVLLAYWYEPTGQWECEWRPFSTGSRQGRYSSVSLHGHATHWQPITPPSAPAGEGGES